MQAHFLSLIQLILGKFKKTLSIAASLILTSGILFWPSVSNAACTSINTNIDVTCTGLTSLGGAGVITNTSPGVITVPISGSGITSTIANETITNTGNVESTAAGAYGVTIGASGTTFNNSGLISLSADNGYTAVVVNGGVSNTTINNNLGGSIIQTGIFGYGIGSFTGYTTINNNGSISATGAIGTGVLTQVNSTVNNTGSISANGQGGYALIVGTSAVINNNSGGSITATGVGGLAIYNPATAIIINNATSGVVIGGGAGSDPVYQGAGIFNDTSSNIASITNNGTIKAGVGGYGINNYGGTITTLNNAQGAGNLADALTYTGILPKNYNIIINSTSSFGRLSVTNGVSDVVPTTFGISTGSTVSIGYKYTAVLRGITADQLGLGTSGTYDGSSYTLGLESGSLNVWDLCFGICLVGPSTADTQQSLVNTASALQGTYTLQNSVLANSFAYDCTLFDKNNICISAGGRNTAVSAANGLNNTSGLLIAAYRPHPNYRVGVYADQNLSVNNAGATVNLGNNTPLIGLFGAWNQRFDGTGTEVKISAAYGQKNVTVTRAVVGTSEAGSGSSQLASQGAQVVAKYGFAVMPVVIVSPYAGIRYTQNNTGGYTEGTSSSVTAPLTYNALNTNATTALAGVGASYKFIPKAMVFASAGVETDTNTANGTYSATGVAGLTPINFNTNPVKTRPTVSVGAYYDIERNQRLGITGIYRQEPYQAVQTTTVMATYTIGL